MCEWRCFWDLLFLLTVLIGSNRVVCVLLRPRLFAGAIGVMVVVLAMVVLLRRRERKALTPAHA